MKRIYLAIDGVLNSEIFFLSKVGYEWWDKPWSREDISKDAIYRLNSLYEGAARFSFREFVLLPSWRHRAVSSRRIKQLMSDLELNIPIHPLMGVDKIEAIREDMALNPGAVPIIVDSSDKYPDDWLKFLVKTDRCFGLTLAKLRILSERILADE